MAKSNELKRQVAVYRSFKKENWNHQKKPLMIVKCRNIDHCIDWFWKNRLDQFPENWSFQFEDVTEQLKDMK